MEKIHKKTASRTTIRLSELDFTPILIALAVVLITIGRMTSFGDECFVP